jgi:hypothetical protein
MDVINVSNFLLKNEFLTRLIELVKSNQLYPQKSEGVPERTAIVRFNFDSFAAIQSKSKGNIDYVPILAVFRSFNFYALLKQLQNNQSATLLNLLYIIKDSTKVPSDHSKCFCRNETLGDAAGNSACTDPNCNYLHFSDVLLHDPNDKLMAKNKDFLEFIVTALLEYFIKNVVREMFIKKSDIFYHMAVRWVANLNTGKWSNCTNANQLLEVLHDICFEYYQSFGYTDVAAQ